MGTTASWPLARNLHTPVCDLLGCTWPVVLTGMGGVARSELVAAVTRAGGFGFLGMVREPVALIRAEVEAVRHVTDLPFGVNLIPASTPPGLLEAQLAACIELRVPVVCLFWTLQPSLVKRLRDAGIVVVCQVGGVDEALAAEAAGADVLIVQGVEAGGHVRGLVALQDLLPAVASLARVPLLAAGGLVDGQDLATVLSLGAQGAVIGTGFLATQESFAHDFHKQRLLSAQARQTVLTDAFHINWPRDARVRVLANSVTAGQRGDPDTPERTVIGDEEGRPIHLFSTDSPLRSTTGDFEAMALYAGEGAHRLLQIVPAAERLRAIVMQASERVDSGAPQAAAPAAPASAPCALHELGPEHLGQAGREAMLEVLNVLLEAERAGARVAMRTAAELPDDDQMRKLVLDIQRDEARWCAVLTRAIRALDGAPSPHTGAFHDKAMAIADVPQRLVFLNRGQAWVVCKLEEWLPRIGDDALHADLRAMLDSHRVNIARVEASPK